MLGRISFITIFGKYTYHIGKHLGKSGEHKIQVQRPQAQTACFVLAWGDKNISYNLCKLSFCECTESDCSVINDPHMGNQK